MTQAITDQFNRQEQLFGKDGQERIKKVRVAIVGLGGTGSHVAQQLAYLGVGEFTLIDDDRVEASNLNRLIGATRASVGRPKVEVAVDLIHTITPSSIVQPIDGDIREMKDVQIIAAVNYVFGCVDNDAARLSLLDICSKSAAPFIDLASEIDPIDGVIGGRVFFSEGGKGCLMCAGLLDQNEIRHLNATKAEKEFEKRIYGVPHESLNGAGPAVVSLNGLIASIAVTEFIHAVSGIMPPKMFTKIQRRRNFGTWTIDHGVTPALGCYYCNEYNQNANKKKIFDAVGS